MKKKVAFFAEKLYGGGVEKILQIILRNFDYEKYDVTLYSSKNEVLREGFYPTGLKHYQFFSSAEGNLYSRLKGKVGNKIKLFVYYHFSPWVFYSLFIRKKYDVGIAFIEGYATRILSGAPKEMKKIAWLHTDMTHNHWTNVAFQNSKEEKNAYCSMNKVVCVSKVVQEKANEIFDLKDKLLILHNPIERDGIIKQSQRQDIDILQSSTHKIRIISLGSLIPVKGYERLLQIAKRLNEERISFELLILGEGNLREKFEQFIVNNNLLEVVKLIGFQENPYPYIKHSDIYVCSSYAEGYNTAITEALVLGKPVVSTECSGVKEQLGEHNEWGICTPNTEEGLYNGIKQMLDANNLAYYTRQAEIRGEHFSLEKSMNDIDRLIDK